MINFILGSFFLFWALLGLPHLSPAQNSPHISGELLIAPKAGVTNDDLEAEYKVHGAQKIAVLSQINVHHIRVPEHALENIEAALSRNPKVEYVEKNFIGFGGMVPN